MSEIITVIQFLRGVGMYRSGEQAGFEPSIAEKLVARGDAVLVAAGRPKVDPTTAAKDLQRRLEAQRIFFGESTTALDRQHDAGKI